LREIEAYVGENNGEFFEPPGDTKEKTERERRSRLRRKNSFPRECSEEPKSFHRRLCKKSFPSIGPNRGEKGDSEEYI